MIETVRLSGQVRSACECCPDLDISFQSLSCGRRQRGAIAIIFALMLVVLVGFLGMSLDLGRVHNRKTELRAVANIAALVAARQLNGTSAGVTNALAKAANAVNALNYQYNQESVSWNDAALSFSTASNGVWLDAGAAQAAPDGLLFVQADTSKLDATLGSVDLVFMRVLSEALASTDVSAKAVAGRSTINVTPLAVCALSNNAAEPRVNPGPPANTELVEFGFRRGVGYDLMQLPNGTSAENFVIDPFDPPGVPGVAGNTASGVVGPYACTGQLAMSRITGAPITVSRPFPLDPLFNQLNSRFDQYGSSCSFVTAPPDRNIKSYLFSTIPWMSPAPGAQSGLNGPLWAYARAVAYSSAEPAGGYTPFNTSAWGTLYPGVPPAKTTGAGSYPSDGSPPYKATNGGTFFLAPPTHTGIANRRVLNVALLSCPVGGGATTTATVLGIGKFLMTVPATSTSLYAEFGGLATEQSLGGVVEIYHAD